MPARRAAALLAALLLTVAAAACGGDDTSDTTAGTSQNGSSTEAGGGSGGDGNDGDGNDTEAGPANPCDAVTQAQWEAIFGSGTTKADASGTRDRCSIATAGASSGETISLEEQSAFGITSFDQALTTYTGCDGEPTEIDLADRAVLDTSCLGQAGTAFVLAQSGDDVLYISLDFGDIPTGDPTAIGDAFAEAATAIVDAR